MKVVVIGATGGKSISRADVADFIVKHLADPATYRAAFGIAY